MLVWDETDILSVLEVAPEIEEDRIWHKYSVKKNGIKLQLTIFQYDGDVNVELFGESVSKPIFSMKLIDCTGARTKIDSTGEFLEFAPSKCFGSRYDGESTIPYGVRIYVKPSINVSLF